MSRGYPIVNSALGADAILINNSWYAYIPQVKFVSGTGTVPNYATVFGRYMVTNNVVRCDIFLDGNGGTAGSGTGILGVSLPVMPSANSPTGYIQVGYVTNNNNQYPLFGILSGTSALLSLGEMATTGAGSPSISALTGADQNNANRTLAIHLWYESDVLPPFDSSDNTSTGGGSGSGSGSPGATGPSGPSGPSGTGPSGPSGPSGVSGPSGTGPSGPSGVSGPSGPAGVSGPSGPSGVSGPSGPSGSAGPSGSNGNTETAATYTPGSGSQTVALDCTNNSEHFVTGNAGGTAITFTVSGVTNNQVFIVMLRQGAVASTVVAWFATIRWNNPGSVVPLLPAATKHGTYGFICTGANTYDGFVIGMEL